MVYEKSTHFHIFIKTLPQLQQDHQFSKFFDSFHSIGLFSMVAIVNSSTGFYYAHFLRLFLLLWVSKLNEAKEEKKTKHSKTHVYSGNAYSFAPILPTVDPSCFVLLLLLFFLNATLIIQYNLIFYWHYTRHKSNYTWNQ